MKYDRRKKGLGRYKVRKSSNSDITTIPQEVKRALGIETGDSISFIITSGGEIEVKKSEEINVKNIQKYSPDEQLGIKVVKALDMTVKQPSQEVFGKELYPDMYSKAGILFINLVKKHCFYNANKRTAWVATMLSFRINGYLTSFTTEEAIDITLKVTTDDREFEELKTLVSEHFRNTSKIYKV